MKVRLYRNLKIRDKRAWSIMAQEGPKKGRVIDIVSGAVIKNAAFRVSEAGRQRVLRERSKNVHAFVEGELVSSTPLAQSPRTRRTGLAPVTYDPYRFSAFQRLDCNEPIAAAPRVVIDDEGVGAEAGPCSSGVRGLRGAHRGVRGRPACALTWDCPITGFKR